MSSVFTIGVSYRTAPLELREALAMPKKAITQCLAQLKMERFVDEAAIISTCNRTELYTRAKDIEPITNWFINQAAEGALKKKDLYCLHAEEAIHHLFRVASGLDSQLLGEPEITGQVKQFAQIARQMGTSGVVINRLMEKALFAAKSVRSSTAIGKNSLSYPALTLQAAKNIFSDLKDCSVLFVGSGDMTRSGVPIFSDAHVRRLAVIGRNLENVEKIAQTYQIESFPMFRLPEILSEFDIIITATASQLPIIGKGIVESALKKRHDKPMMFADLALPRDLEIEINSLNSAFVYNLDHFGHVASLGLEERQSAALQAEIILNEHVHHFCQWLESRNNTHRMRLLQDTVKKTKEDSLQTAFLRLHQGEDADIVLSDTVNRLTQQLSHLPTRLLQKQIKQESFINNHFGCDCEHLCRWCQSIESDSSTE